MNSLNLYNKEHSTNNKIVVTNPQQSNSYMLPQYGGYFKVYERELTRPVTITVGPGGQFSTLNEAFREAMKYDAQKWLIGIEKPRDQTYPITILLKTGFVMRESLHLTGGFNYAYIRIKTETFITCNRETLKDDYYISFSGYRAFFYGANRVIYPTLEGDFRVDTTGGTTGTAYSNDIINLIMMNDESSGRLIPGSKFEGGYYTVSLGLNSSIIALACTFKGNKYTSQVLRVHGGEINCARSIIELGTDKDPGIISDGEPVCLWISGGGAVNLSRVTFKNSPKAIISDMPILLEHTVFENITGNYAIGDHGVYGKGLIINASSNISKIGNAQLTDHGVNQFLPGKGLMIQ